MIFSENRSPFPDHAPVADIAGMAGLAQLRNGGVEKRRCLRYANSTVYAGPMKF